MKNNPSPKEHDECVAFVQYLDMKRLRFSHIAHETYTKSWGVKARNKQEGVRRGVPDYIIITKKGLLFVEMKRKKGSTISDEQKDWILELQELEGIEAMICFGSEEAIAFVETFI